MTTSLRRLCKNISTNTVLAIELKQGLLRGSIISLAVTVTYEQVHRSYVATYFNKVSVPCVRGTIHSVCSTYRPCFRAQYFAVRMFRMSLVLQMSLMFHSCTGSLPASVVCPTAPHCHCRLLHGSHSSLPNQLSHTRLLHSHNFLSISFSSSRSLICSFQTPLYQEILLKP